MRRTLSRRTLLRGVGVAAGLRFFEGMRAEGPDSRELPKLAIVYSPNGMHMPAWTPEGPPGPLRLSPTLQSLEPLRDRCTVITGLRFDPAVETASVSGPHSLACAGFLSGAAPLRSEGQARAAVSLDQAAAKTCGEESWFPSLEFACEEPVPGSDREPGFSTAYLNHVSWRTPYQPMPAASDPLAAFERLFRGDAGQWIKNTYARTLFNGDAGAADRTRLARYLSELHDLEQQIQDVGTLSRRERDFLIVDLAALALQCGVTRVATIMLGREKSRAAFPELKIFESHHQLSQRYRDKETMDKLMAIDRYHADIFAHFARRLNSFETAGGSVLDSTVLLYGSGLSDGREHRHDDLPIVIVGGNRTRDSAGQHVPLARQTDLRWLHAAVLHWFSSGSWSPSIAAR